MEINNHPNMSTAFYRGHKTTYQIDKNMQGLAFSDFMLHIIFKHVYFCDLVLIMTPNIFL